MPDFAITGKKGSGKSLYCVGVISDALRAGKRVATNLDIRLDCLMIPVNQSTYFRLPDRPTAADLEAIGRGQDGVCEEDNGLIVLDETSTFFNSRAYGDKSRQPLLDWLVHSRKYGWDVYYICQGLDQIDKQLRSTMIEYHTMVKRTDKWPIPFLTPLGKLFGLNIRFPKMHLGITKHGVDLNAMVVDRKFYLATDLYPAYDTQQIFLDRDHPQAVGLHSVLSAWHLKGRYLPVIYSPRVRILRSFLGLPPFPTVEQKDMPLPRKTKLVLGALLFLAPVAAWAFMNMSSADEKPKEPSKPIISEVPPGPEQLFSTQWRLVGNYMSPNGVTIFVLQTPEGRIRRYLPAKPQLQGYETVTLPDGTIVTPFSGSAPQSKSSENFLLKAFK